MDTTSDNCAAQIPIRSLVAAAQALSRAARWDEAFTVLDAAEPATDAAREALAIAAARVAVDCDYVTASKGADDRIEHARRLASASSAPGEQWTVAYLHLRHSYYQALRRHDSYVHLGPDGRDLAEVDGLRDEAQRVRDNAPTTSARGWAEMCLGLIADNLSGRRDLAPQHYSAALRAGETNDDDLLVFEALRHLGDHDHDRGDHAAALDRWQRATAAAARAGTIPGTLAQQLLLAVLARDVGDEAGGQLLAAEVARWAEAIGAVNICAQATAFLDGADATVPLEAAPSTTPPDG